MNLLILNHYAGSPAHGMEYRPYYLAREWVRLGHQVTIVAASFSHVRSQQPRVRERVREEVIDGITYQWLPTPAYRGNGWRRGWNVLSYLAQVWGATPGLVKRFRPDVVIASSTYPIDIWPARRLARLAGAQLVYEVHDLWPLSPIELSGMSRWHPFMLWCQRAEDLAYRDADAVVSMLPLVHEHMAGRGLDLRKLTIVPNGITLEDWTREPESLAPGLQAVLQPARERGATVVGYAGSMGLPNALDTLLDAAAAMRDEPFVFVLVGSGHEQARLQQRVAGEGLRNVHLLPPIPKAQIPSFLAAIDIAYIGWQRVPIYRFGIAPNKLMDYMMAGCVVLHAVEAGNDPVAEVGAGLTVAPEDPAAVVRGLRALAALPAAERRAMGERGRAFVQAHHTYPVLAQRFLGAVRPGLAREPGPGTGSSPGRQAA